DGTFQPAHRVADVGYGGDAAVADVDGDGRPDLVAADANGDTLSVLPGNGDGTFRPERRFPAGEPPGAGGGAGGQRGRRPDHGPADFYGADLSVLVGTGGGSFAPSAPQRAVDPRPTPRRGDLDGDHVPDLVTLNDAGEILFRRGLPGGENRFEPPVIVNP